MSETAEGEVQAAPRPPLLPLIMGILNTVAILAAVGLLVYTKILFKRPKITEETERTRLAQLKAAPKTDVKTGYVAFDTLTINISPSPTAPKAADGTQTQIQGKLHYATIGFALELRDIARKDEVEAIKPLITDQLLSIVGKKQFHELTSVQGRYVLKTQMIEIVNGLAAKRLEPGKPDPGPVVQDMYFSQFIVQ